MDAMAPATAWYEAWEPRLLQIGSSRYALIRPLSLTQELLEGTLPNPLLARITGDVPARPATRDAATIKQHYRLMVQVAVRAMVYPKLMTPERLRLYKQDKPDASKGQIGLEHLHYLHLSAIYEFALDLYVPPMSSLPYTPRAPFAIDTLSAEKLARIAAQAERQHVAPSHWLGLGGSDFAAWRDAVGSEVVTFWTWAIDDACDYALLAVREQAQAARANQQVPK